MVIMSVIPFGAVGAIVGHYVLDVQLMFFSALGIVALAGVVVNSSLVLVDYANRQRREGLDAFAAISKAAVVRFRPIILTSVTTFVGLIPLMTTTTPATGPFLPIAISLAWGVLFATVLPYCWCPACMMIEDLLALRDDVVSAVSRTIGRKGALLPDLGCTVRSVHACLNQKSSARRASLGLTAVAASQLSWANIHTRNRQGELLTMGSNHNLGYYRPRQISPIANEKGDRNG